LKRADEPATARLLGSLPFIEMSGVLGWRRKARMRVDARCGRWHDFQSGMSGGVTELVLNRMVLSRSDAVKRLLDEGFLSTPGVSFHQPIR